MNAGTVAAIITALFTLISGLTAAYLGYRASRQTAKADLVAAQFESQDEHAKNLQASLEAERTENERLHALIRDLRNDIDHGDRRAKDAINEARTECAELRGHLRDMLSNLRALQSVVVDEMARAAADVVATQTEHLIHKEVEDEVKSFLRQAPREEPT